MGKRNLLCMMVLVSVVLMFAATGAAKSITLTFANQNPDTSWSGMNAIGPWAKQVEKATNGKVKIQIFFSQTLNFPSFMGSMRIFSWAVISQSPTLGITAQALTMTTRSDV